VADEYGVDYHSEDNKESKEYIELMQVLDSMGAVRDLLKESNGGEHPPTRPPRFEFPQRLDYLISNHKYPQRLDYIFARHMQANDSIAGVRSLVSSASSASSLSGSGAAAAGAAGGGGGGGASVPTTSPTTTAEGGLRPAECCEDAEDGLMLRVVAGSTRTEEFVVKGQPFTHISDHYGIRTTLLYRGPELSASGGMRRTLSSLGLADHQAARVAAQQRHKQHFFMWRGVRWWKTSVILMTAATAVLSLYFGFQFRYSFHLLLVFLYLLCWECSVFLNALHHRIIRSAWSNQMVLDEESGSAASEQLPLVIGSYQNGHGPVHRSPFAKDAPTVPCPEHFFQCFKYVRVHNTPLCEIAAASLSTRISSVRHVRRHTNNASHDYT